MAWTYALDNATPLGSQAPSVIDDSIRLIKEAMQERLNADHYWPLTGTAVSDTDAGKHRKLTLQAVLSTKPTLLTGEAALYSKTVSGASEVFAEDSAGNEIQLSSGGALNVLVANIQGILTNDTYWTAIDEAGTGTVNLIKAGRNEADDTDVAVLPDLVRTASNAAPLEDTAVANKKFVDDQVDTKNFGAWSSVDSLSASLASGEVYKADCDGFVVAYSDQGNTHLLTDGSNPPTTRRSQDADADNTWSNVFCPIRKDDYVKVVGNTAIIGYYWLPMGTGNLVKQ